MRQLYEIQISVFLSEILLEYCHAHFFIILSMAAFLLQWQSYAARETIWTAKLKTFIICHFREKFADPWCRPSEWSIFPDYYTISSNFLSCLAHTQFKNSIWNYPLYYVFPKEFKLVFKENALFTLRLQRFKSILKLRDYKDKWNKQFGTWQLTPGKYTTQLMGAEEHRHAGQDHGLWACAASPLSSTERKQSAG